MNSAPREGVSIVSGMRTPVGKERGKLAAFPAWELGAAAIRALLNETHLDHVDRVILGNVTNGGNVARVAALGAGLSPTTPCSTLNNQCASGLTAIRVSAEAIGTSAADVVIAGGAESVSNTIVHLGTESRRSDPAAAGRPRMTHAPPPYVDPEIGETADILAARLGISRGAQDGFVLESRRRTARAQADGFYAANLAAVGHGELARVERDELVERSLSADLLRRLRPQFSNDGSVTAGNTAMLGDGATVILLASVHAVRAHNLRPIAKIVATAAAAVDPADTPLAAVAAAERALDLANLSPRDIDRWDINEAFAAKALAFRAHFAIDPAALNARGGALGYGHAFAASGATSLLHLSLELRATGRRFGLAAIAGAGGVGECVILERLQSG